MTEEKGNTGFIPEDFNDSAAYFISFGNIPNHTPYVKPFEEVDIRPEIKSRIVKGIEMERAQLKAFSIGGMGAGTAGYDMVPVFVDTVMIDRSRKYTPASLLTKRVTNQGLYADFNYISSKGGAFTAGDDAALSEADDSKARDSTPIKYMYAVGRVTGPTQAAVPSYLIKGWGTTGDGMRDTSYLDSVATTALDQEVILKAQSMKELEENLFFNGNATTSGITGNPDGTEYDGIVALQSTTNQNDLNSTAMDLDDIEDTVRYAFDDSGRPEVGFGSSTIVTDFRKKWRDAYRVTPEKGEVALGVVGSSVEGLMGPMKLIPSQFLSNVSGAKQLFFLDMEKIEHRVLQDMTYQEMGINNDSKKFFLKQYQTIIDRAPAFNSFIDNVL